MSATLAELPLSAAPSAAAPTAAAAPASRTSPAASFRATGPLDSRTHPRRASTSSAGTGTGTGAGTSAASRSRPGVHKSYSASSSPAPFTKRALPTSRSLPTVAFGKDEHSFTMVADTFTNGSLSLDDTLVAADSLQENSLKLRHQLQTALQPAHLGFKPPLTHTDRPSRTDTSMSSSSSSDASSSSCAGSSGSSSSSSSSQSGLRSPRSHSNTSSPRIEDSARMEAPAPWEQDDVVMHDVDALARMALLSPAQNGPRENGAAPRNTLLPAAPLQEANASAAARAATPPETYTMEPAPVGLPASAGRQRRVPLAEIPLWYADVRGEYLRRVKQERSGLSSGFSGSPAHVLSASTSHNMLHHQAVPYLCPTASSAHAAEENISPSLTPSSSSSSTSGLALLGLSAIDEQAMSGRSGTMPASSSSMSLFVLADEPYESPHRKEQRALRRKSSSLANVIGAAAAAAAGGPEQQQQQQQQQQAHAKASPYYHTALSGRRRAGSRGGR